MPGFPPPVKVAPAWRIACGAAALYCGSSNGKQALKEPTIEAEARPQRRRRSQSRRHPALRWVRRLIIAAVVVVALPLALSLVYAVPGVRPVSMLMVADLVTLRGYDRQWVSLEDMGSALPHAVMMSEDGQFCSHRGVDWGELNAVIEGALAGEPARGASTIPMQTVKNLFLWHGRSYLRKALEVPLAIYFDAVLPKRRILEIYLNIAEWGPNVYGAEAAAQHHFGRAAKELSARQAALLAVTLPSPATRNPARPGPGMERIASVVQRRAARAGGYVDCLSP